VIHRFHLLGVPEHYTTFGGVRSNSSFIDNCAIYEPCTVPKVAPRTSHHARLPRDPFIPGFIGDRLITWHRLLHTAYDCCFLCSGRRPEPTCSSDVVTTMVGAHNMHDRLASAVATMYTGCQRDKLADGMALNGRTRLSLVISTPGTRCLLMSYLRGCCWVGG
jgi:hypothetical protein